MGWLQIEAIFNRILYSDGAFLVSGKPGADLDPSSMLGKYGFRKADVAESRGYVEQAYRKVRKLSSRCAGK